MRLLSSVALCCSLCACGVSFETQEGTSGGQAPVGGSTGADPGAGGMNAGGDGNGGANAGGASGGSAPGGGATVDRGLLARY